MESQSAMPAADAASTVVDVLSARMGEVPADGEGAGSFLACWNSWRRYRTGGGSGPGGTGWRRSWRWCARRSRRGPGR